MATEQQLIEGLRRADAAGDTAGAQAIANELRRVRSAPQPTIDYNKVRPARAEQINNDAVSNFERMIAGFTPQQRAVAIQRFNTDPRIANLRTQAQKPHFKNDSVVDHLTQGVKGMAGNLLTGASAAPDLMASGGRAAGNAVGNTIAALGDMVIRPHSASGAKAFTDFMTAPQRQNVPTLTDRSRAMFPEQDQMPGSTQFFQQALGGLLVPLGPKGGRPPVRPPLNAPWRQAASKAASNVAAAAPRVIPEAAEVVNAGKQAGVRVMTSDIRPPRTFVGKATQALGERIPVAGTGGMRAAQQAERVAAVRSALVDFGGHEARGLLDDAPRAVDEIAAGLASQRGAQLDALTRAKTQIIQGLPGAVPTPRAIAALDGQIARLQGLNSADVAPIITKLEGWKTALQNQPLTNIEQLRKIMGQAFDDPGLAGIKSVGQDAVNSIYGPLREDMATFIKQTGGEAAHSQWANANAKLSEMAGDLSNTAFRRALQTAEMTPENVGRMIFSKNRSDVQRLYSNLDAPGKAKMQSAVLQKAFDNAIGAEGLSVERFLTNLDQLGESSGVIFRGADRERIVGLSRVLDATRRAATTSAHPPTGVQNNLAAGGFALGSIFGNAAIPVAGVGGLFARAYESGPVRDMFIRLSRTKPGSPAERNILANLNRSLRDVASRYPGVAAAAANDGGGLGYGASAAASPEEEQRQQQRGF